MDMVEQFLRRMSQRVEVLESTFTSNTAKTQGGAILFYQSTAKVIDCNFGGANDTDSNSAMQGAKNI